MLFLTPNRDDESCRFEALLNASLGIVVVNSVGAIHSVNSFALKLFGEKYLNA